MSELTKNVKPLDDFNWEEFENGTSASISKEELDKAYDETLNKVADHQVVDGKVISVDKNYPRFRIPLQPRPEDR